MSRNYEPLNIKLYSDEDADIIKFLSDKPKAYFVKRALRVYMNEVFENVPTKDQSPKKNQTQIKNEDDSDLKELF